jgi:predicted anti-sigma-YlaC factor YlaD
MECDRAREAISARIDGEDPGLPGSALDAHLASCADCRDWQQRAHEVTRRARLGGPFPERDLTPQVLAVIRPVAARRRRVLAQRAGLVTVALAQLAITVPLLILGHDHGAGSHAAHELGSFDLALAVAFAVGAIRPALSAGLAWPCGIAAAGLVITAITDLVSGQTFGADEAQHLIGAAGAALLFWQARTSGAGAAGPALATRGPRTLPRPGPAGATGQVAVLRPETQPEPSGGGSVTGQLTGTDMAAARDGGEVA